MLGGNAVPNSYGETVNADLLEFIGQLHGTVVDIGCGRGAWAPLLRKAGANHLVGVEPSADAEIARSAYDIVLTDVVERTDLPLADTIIAADVLEHLHDPWAALATLRSAAHNETRLFISVPNVQFVKAITTMARGDFPYEDGGFWDRTHVRWFTRRSLSRVLDDTDWCVSRTAFAFGNGKRSSLARIFAPLGPYLGHQLQLEAAPAISGGHR